MGDLEQGLYISGSKATGLHGKTSALPVKENFVFAHVDDPHGANVIPNLKLSKIDKYLWLRKFFMLAIIFTVSLSMVIVLFLSLPKIGSTMEIERWRTEDETSMEKSIKVKQDQSILQFPKDFEQLRAIRRILELYQKEHRRQVQLGIMFLYIFLQTFMIPGTVFLNVLAGSFYGFYEALLLVTILASAGSTGCYFLSRYILKDLVYYYFPERCEWLAREVHRHRHNLLNYILFLRITPLLPNWFINVSAPLVSIPYRDYLVGTFLGVIPASVVAVKAGSILSQINSMKDLYDVKTVLTLFFLAFLVMLPVFVKRRPHDQGSATVKAT
ncbi:hypothetical protein O6H91_03G096800 [Diphasiastrum complanatum]|uniref:Uncharacterized protein n=2 Tax=Diphasiastrum complanatum TaxID=34168 RepID=A0ACC2E9U3_DIPCM|nr:hypothetical protein O6H91_03G096800 [Diphasiastrum complanatum]KAJ7563110.1 hypothetical protein O6H91_03G096800 [Diphasiastrum complanatum]